MPKYGIHYLVLDKTIKKLKDQRSTNAEADRLYKILNNNRFEANLGAIGPDMLFWAPDYSIVKSVQDLVNIYNEVDKHLDALKELGETIEEAIEKPLTDFKNALANLPIVGPVINEAFEWHEAFEHIKESYEQVFGGIEDEIKQALFVKIIGLDGTFKGPTQARSLFQGLFQPALQAGKEETEWYWFDMLHYRNTGDFVKNLVANAEASGNDSLKAYAYGYMTHYATDLVGHPFVNTVSGAPYRISVQRHVVIENFMDQSKWFGEKGKNIRNSLYDAFGFEDVRELPQNIARLISDTLKETYADVVHPLIYSRNEVSDAIDAAEFGFLEPQDIKTAYQFQRNILQFLGGQEDHIRPEEPYEGADADLAQLMATDDRFNPPPSMPDLPADLSPEALEQWINLWLQAIQNLFEWFAECVSTAMDIVADVLTAIATSENLSADARKLILLINYWIQLEIYSAYRAIHQVLSLAGLTYPEPEDVRLNPGEFKSTLENIDSVIDCLNISNQFAERFLVTGKDSITGSCSCNGSSPYVNGFPVLRSPGQSHLEYSSYVQANYDSITNQSINNSESVQFSHFERPCTVPSFYPKGSTSDVFISGVPLNTKLLEDYAKAATPEDTRKLYETQNGKSFGNAVDLCVYLMTNARTSDQSLKRVVYCNWNLDGDRGYGYHAWDGVPYTVIPDEINSLRANNEDNPEFRQMCSQVWSSVSLDANNISKYKNEQYVTKKSIDDTILCTLNISEALIPSIFTKSPFMATPPEWTNLVPKRFRFSGNSIEKNFLFVNGLTTTPCAGLRAGMSLKKALNEAYSRIPISKDFGVNYFHNYTSLYAGDFQILFDLIEGTFADFKYAVEANTAHANNFTRPDITNTTQVALVALLHHCMESKIPLLVSGHSQGAMITGNAILAFAGIGAKQRDYLKQQVKVFHIEPEILNPVRKTIRSLVKSYLVYIMNRSDPFGVDPLTEFLASDAVAVAASTPRVESFVARMNNHDPLDFTFYTDMLMATSGLGNDYLRMIKTILDIRNTGMFPHYMPRQMPILKADIINDRFRTDPGTIDITPTQQLSTPNSINNTSIKVRAFFLD